MVPGKLVACDTETTGLHFWKGDRPFGFSFCNTEGDTAYVEWPVNPKTRKPLADKKSFRQIKDFFLEPSVTKVFHHGHFDVRGLASIGIEVAGPGGLIKDGGKFEDTLLAARCFKSNEISIGLKPLTDKYFSYPLDDQQELKEAVKKARHIAKRIGWKIAQVKDVKLSGGIKTENSPNADFWIPRTMALHYPNLAEPGWLDVCGKYCIGDAERTMLLWIFYNTNLDPKDRKTYLREKSYWPATYYMIDKGIRVIPENMEATVKECIKTAGHSYQFIQQKNAGKRINIASPQQVSELLYKRCGIKPFEYTKEGMAKVDRLSLEKHIHIPVVREVATWRGMDKSFGFLQAYKRLMSKEPRGIRVLHPSFNQVGTITGRYTCSDPNMQQISNPDASPGLAVMNIRKVFGPRPGYVWLMFDYQGQEMRLFIDIANEVDILRSLREKGADADIHGELCNRIWGGKNNPRAIQAAVRVLELDGVVAGGDYPELRKLWKQWRLSPGKDIPISQQEELATSWLERFNWNIVEAEKSIGKKIIRGRTKVLNFLRIYGGGVNAASIQLQCSVSEAMEAGQAYVEALPGMQATQRMLTDKAREDGFIETLWGRRIIVDPGEEYKAVNYKVQGSAADQGKEALRRVHNWLRAEDRKASIVMFIHDELVLEVAKDTLTGRLVKTIKRIMEDHQGRLKVTIPVDVSVAPISWDKKKKIV